MPRSGRTHSVRKLGAPGVSQATEVVLRSVWQPARLPKAPAGAKNISAGTNTPRPPTPSVPLTKLLSRQGLTGTRLLLALATTKASTLRGSTTTSTTAAVTSTTATAASTATPSASSTTSIAAPIVPSTTLAPLALAVAVPPTRSRRSPDLLSSNEVNNSSREGGQGNTPQRKGREGRREKHLQLRYSSQLQ
ncbi:unnamed protein product [Closterium sp. NIES-53]